MPKGEVCLDGWNRMVHHGGCRAGPIKGENRRERDECKKGKDEPWVRVGGCPERQWLESLCAGPQGKPTNHSLRSVSQAHLAGA